MPAVVPVGDVHPDRAEVEAAVRHFAQCGFEHQDMRWANMATAPLDEDRVVLIDFEQVVEISKAQVDDATARMLQQLEAAE